MNSEKAKEFFSAYFEGSLEEGLSLAVEQKLKSDRQLQAEFELFASTYKSLNALKDEEIEVPIFLSDRIATKLEAAREHRSRPGLLWNFGWLRAAPNGLGLVAIVGAVLGIAATGVVAKGGFLPDLANHKAQIDLPTFKVDGTNVMLEYVPHGSHTVVIKKGASGAMLRTLNLEDGQPMEPKLNNEGANAQLFSVQEDSERAQYVVVPGRTSDSSHPTAEGTLADFALSVANYYHVPVLLENVDLDKKLKWSFVGIDAVKAANTNLAQVNLSADLRTDGMLSINH